MPKDRRFLIPSMSFIKVVALHKVGRYSSMVFACLALLKSGNVVAKSVWAVLILAPPQRGTEAT